MEKLIFKRQKFIPSESITYHFGDNKILYGTRRPEIELNPSLFNNESQEDDDEEEKEMEFDCMQPKIKKEEEEEDPLKIDDIKPEICNLETDNKLKRVVLLIANRRKELLTTDAEKKPNRRKKIVSNEKHANGSVGEKLNNSSEPSKNIKSIVNNGRKKYTGYTLWRKEMRLILEKDNSDKTFREISIILDQKWKTVKSYEKIQYRIRAKEVNDKMIRINQGKKDLVKTVKIISPPVEFEEAKKISRKGRVISKPTKLADFYKSHLEKNEKDSFKRTKKQLRESLI